MQALLRREQAAEYVQAKYGFCTKRSLAKYATVGGGPLMIYVGRKPFYTPEALENWVRAKMSDPVASTSGALNPASSSTSSGGDH